MLYSFPSNFSLSFFPQPLPLFVLRRQQRRAKDRPVEAKVTTNLTARQESQTFEHAFGYQNILGT